MKNNLSTQNNPFISKEVSDWFDGFIAQVRTDQLTLETDTADLEKKDFYNNLIQGNQFEVASKVRDVTNQFMIENIVREYIIALFSKKPNLQSLAFNLSSNKILVWAVIENDDEKTEDALFLAEAKANAKFFEETGICIDSTVVEERDGVNIPPHYQKVKIGK